jgi:hypothetical protein
MVIFGKKTLFATASKFLKNASYQKYGNEISYNTTISRFFSQNFGKYSFFNLQSSNKILFTLVNISELRPLPRHGTTHIRRKKNT